MKGSKEYCGDCGRFFRQGFSECDRDGCPFTGDIEPEVINEDADLGGPGNGQPPAIEDIDGTDEASDAAHDEGGGVES